MRTVLMERAVIRLLERLATIPLDGDSDRFNQHVFHVANAHATAPHAVILAALSRLDDRFHAKFCSSLRHFAPSPGASKTETKPETNNEAKKEESPCSPSH